MQRFPSALPGGNRRGKSSRKCCVAVEDVLIPAFLFILRLETTLLDCIYREVDKTFCVLDIMNWMTHPLYDSEVLLLDSKYNCHCIILLLLHQYRLNVAGTSCILISQTTLNQNQFQKSIW
jgi:hypothetical protein